LSCCLLLIPLKLCVAAFVDMALIVTDFPLEIMVHILSLLPVVDLLQAMPACRLFCHAANIAYSRRHRKQLGLLLAYICYRTIFLILMGCP